MLAHEYVRGSSILVSRTQQHATSTRRERMNLRSRVVLHNSTPSSQVVPSTSPLPRRSHVRTWADRSAHSAGPSSRRVTDFTPARMTFLATSAPTPFAPTMSTLDFAMRLWNVSRNEDKGFRDNGAGQDYRSTNAVVRDKKSQRVHGHDEHEGSGLIVGIGITSLDNQWCMRQCLSMHAWLWMRHGAPQVSHEAVVLVVVLELSLT